MKDSSDLMPIAVLTAACQEGDIPREEFENEPLGAARKSLFAWIDIAREKGLNGLQVSAALCRPDAYVPPEAMLDPVGAQLPIRTAKNGKGVDLSDEHAEEIIAACGDDIKIFDIGFFENLLHRDPKIRNQVHEHLLRCARAAVKLKAVGCRGVTTFIGRDTRLSMDENLRLYEKYVIPLLEEFKKLGLILWIENCPMPGWSLDDVYVQNIAYCPGMWILLVRIADKHCVGDVLRITYDASHDILMGSTPFASFSLLKEAGFEDAIDKIHGKDQNRNRAKVAAWGMLGQRAGLGITVAGKLVTDPKLMSNAWGRMTAHHTLPGISEYNPYAQICGEKVDWVEHQLDARSILGIIPANSVFIIEHEWGPARDQNIKRVSTLIGISAKFVRGADMTAAGIFEAQKACRKLKLPWQTAPNPNRIIPGLQEEVARILAIPV